MKRLLLFVSWIALACVVLIYFVSIDSERRLAKLENRLPDSVSKDQSIDEISLPAATPSLPHLNLGSQHSAAPSDEPAPALNPEKNTVKFNEAQNKALEEITSLAGALADTYDEEGYEAPPIPPELEKKLNELSPALLALVKVATRIPPRNAEKR